MSPRLRLLPGCALRPLPAAPSSSRPALRIALPMKSKSARLVRRNHARYHRGRDDLNIVPMIDMMVILVFFLIFTAVFYKTNILQLNLPANASAPVDLPKGLKLEVIIRPNDLVVNDRNSGPLKVIPNTPAGYDLDGLSEFMRKVKAQFPEMTDATILP